MKNRNVDEEMPQWDVAIESLVRDEYRKLNRALTIEDFQRLGTEYKIRFDDIMATLAQLCSHREWLVNGKDAQGKGVGAGIVDELFPYGRLDERVARRYSISWQPR